MKVFITGGNGFIGTALTDHFLSKRVDVTIFDRAEPPVPLAEHFADLPGAFRFHTGDIRDGDALTAALGADSYDYFIHGAVITAAGERERTEAHRIIDVNVMGTMTAIEALRRHPVKRALYISSASAYGEAAFDTGPLDETANRPVPDSLYAISKYASERAWRRVAGTMDTDMRAIRLGAAYGPFERQTGLRDTMSPPFQIMAARLAGQPATMDRDGLRDWIYVRDIVAAIDAILGADGLSEFVFNIGLGQDAPISAFCRSLEAAVPGFKWKIDAPAAGATVNLHGDRDRSQLAIERLKSDAGYTPVWTPDRAAVDYEAWCQAHPALARFMMAS